MLEYDFNLGEKKQIDKGLHAILSGTGEQPPWEDGTNPHGIKRNQWVSVGAPT